MPMTAALDPIFWLHHANIDRLWEWWRTKDVAPDDPPRDPDYIWSLEPYRFASPVHTSGKRSVMRKRCR